MKNALTVTVRPAPRTSKPLFVLSRDGKTVGQFTATLKSVMGNVGSAFTAIVAALGYSEAVTIEKRMFAVDRESIVGDNEVTEFLRSVDNYLSVQNIREIERMGVSFVDDDGNRFSPQAALNKTAYQVRNIKLAQKG